MLATVHALAVDTVSHLAGEAPVINAEKEFDRFMKSYEFAIEAQKLKREDITNLMELVVDRMDMYHLIGALLLEFCVGFYGEFKMLEEDYVKEPKLIMEIFLLSNIAAVGYLLFAIWLSLHASVAAHAIGVEFLLDHNRLTIPTPDNLREMRQATSLFRSVYRLFQKKLCAPQQPGAGQVPGPLPGPAATASNTIAADMAASSVELGEPSLLTLEALATNPNDELKMPRIKNDLIKHEHRAKFAEHHRAWLRFDAYSRVAMALGINQMLQSMSYFIAGPVQKHRPSFALITVMGVQAIAFFLLKLDWRTMDTENSDDESEKPNKSKRKDVSSLEGSEFVFICITYLLPPVMLVVILWIAHYFFSDPATGDLDHQGRIVSRVLSTPIFFLHAIWLYLVRQSIAPHHNDLLPVRLRTVGYLDVFTRDALVEELMGEEEEEVEASQEKSTTRRRRGRKSSKNRTSLAALRTVTLCDSIVFDGEEEYLEHVECSVGRSSPRSHTKDMSPRSPTSDMSPDVTESHPLKGRFSVDTPKQKSDPARRGHDHVAWLVLGRFTTTMIWLWLFGGFIHTVNFFLDVGGSPIDVNGIIQQSSPTKVLPDRRRLVAQWPEPANFFEVTSLHCNSSGMVIGTPFAVHSARRTYGMNGSHAIGPLSQIGEFEMKTAWCGPGQGCSALAREAGGAWHLRSLSGPEDQSPSPPVPLPDSWQIVAAAPVQEQQGRAALLSAWDGQRVVIASLAHDASGAWRLHRRFAVHQPLGNCTEEGTTASDASAAPASGREAAVQGLYVDTSSGCQTLAVLRSYAGDGYVDGWDLNSGKHMGCWKISPQSQYGALCHDGANLLLARQSSEGPILESTLLPKTFAQCQKSPSAAAAPVKGTLRSTAV